MAKVNDLPALRANYAAALAATPHLHEGKLAKLDANGQIALATSAAEVLGVICDPDAHSVATAGNATGATIYAKTFGGIVELKVGTLSGALAAGDPLYFATGGVVSDDSSNSAVQVAICMEPVTATTAGQLVRAILI